MKQIIGILLLCHSVIASEITLAVAANVSYAIEALQKAFNGHYPDTKVRVILGSSGKLTAQIRHGAPYGLFMSANMKYPQALYDDGLALQSPRVYAKGSLSFFSVKTQDFSQGMALLKANSVKRIAVANPETAPYGKAAIEAMKQAEVYDALKDKLVFADSISQTLSYTLTAVDIGLIASSSLYSNKMADFKEHVHWEKVNSDLYTPIEQGVVLLKGSENQEGYQHFFDFLFSEEAQSILMHYGYTI